MFANTLVPEILKFEKYVNYANEMTDDVIHSSQYYLSYMNRAISIFLGWPEMPLILQRSGTQYVAMVTKLMLVLWSTFGRLLLQRSNISDTNWLRSFFIIYEQN